LSTDKSLVKFITLRFLHEVAKRRTDRQTPGEFTFAKNEMPPYKNPDFPEKNTQKPRRDLENRSSWKSTRW